MGLILLHTHSIMAFILATTQVGMLTYLLRLRHKTLIRRWMIANYVASIVWQLDQTVRFSLHPSATGSLPYKLETVFVYSPALALLMLTYFQLLYLFLDQPLERERRIMVRIVIPIAVSLVALNAWNEFGNNSNLFLFQLLSFVYGLLTNIWALVICLRKARLLKRHNPKAATAHYALAWVNGGFICMCLMAVGFGFYSPVGYWSFFIFIWLCNIAQIVIYISFSAVPASFQVKVAGFSFVSIITFLTVVTLVFFPPLLPSELTARLSQQSGLAKMFAIIGGATLFVVLVLPGLLRQTLTDPVNRLLAGVQQVNDGDLTAQVPVGSPDEIGDLTLHFNRMTQSLRRAQDQLREYAETLEGRVMERTAELEQSLTSLRITQDQLIHQEKMASLGELTAGIAHEIQNPLNFVNNFSKLSVRMLYELTDEVTANHPTDALAIADELADNLQKISHHGGRASSIVRGMLEHSRSTPGERQPTDLNTLCAEYLHLAYQGMKAKQADFNVQLLTNYDPAIGLVTLVPQDIGRVLLNLFNNAFYAVHEKQKSDINDYKPTIRVSTDHSESGVEIRVADNGGGIPDAVKAKIFQPFFTTKPTGSGTGLGLSLAYDIITKGHGGTIEVESAEGQGTTFIVKLPKMQ